MKTLIAADEPEPRPTPSYTYASMPFGYTLGSPTAGVTSSTQWSIVVVDPSPSTRAPYRTTAHVGKPVEEIEQ